MILDNILNESFGSNDHIANLDAIETSMEANAGSVMVLHQESIDYYNRLEEGMMLCEQMALAQTVKGRENAAVMIQEGAIGDFFGKIVELFKKMYQKVKGWFKSLMTYVSTAVGDVNKTLEKYKKELDKDFSNYKYHGHSWKSNDISKLGSNADKIRNSIVSSLNGISISGAEAQSNISKDDKNYNHSIIGDRNETENSAVKGAAKVSEPNMIHALLNSGSFNTNDETTVSEAKTQITEAVRGEGSGEEIKGFSAVSISNMVDFIKKFSDNKVLKEAQAKVDKNYNDAISSASKIKDKILGFENKANNVNAKKSINTKTTLAKTYIDQLRCALKSYDSLMAIHIDLEKEKFSEFKKAVIGAIRYKEK